MSDEVDQMTRVINEITEGVQVSSSNTYEVHRLMDELLKETKKMNSILASINKLSNSTKILGLYAAGGIFGGNSSQHGYFEFEREGNRKSYPAVIRIVRNALISVYFKKNWYNMYL